MEIASIFLKITPKFTLTHNGLQAALENICFQRFTKRVNTTHSH